MKTVGRKKNRSKKRRRRVIRKVVWAPENTVSYSTKREQAEIEQLWRRLISRGVIV